LISNLTVKNIENTQLIINLNNITKDLNISNNKLQEKIKENNDLIINLQLSNKQNETFIYILIGSIFIIIFILIFLFISIFCSIILIILFLFIIFCIQFYFKKYKTRLKLEKKLLGEKKNININQFINLTEEDFKIDFKNIKIMEELGEGTTANVFKEKYYKQIISLKYSNLKKN
jgi:Ca2+/Na+ antiporter